MSNRIEPSLLCMWLVLNCIPNDGLYYNFKRIEADTSMGPDRIRVNVKELRKRGYVEFARGLMSDENRVQGSGYAITPAGCDWLDSLQLCETCERPRLIHACITCAPGWPIAKNPGPGCINCRNTGWNQTPCQKSEYPGRLS